jgi:Fe-S-cluster-containing hydrogenase component 2
MPAGSILPVSASFLVNGTIMPGMSVPVAPLAAGDADVLLTDELLAQLSLLAPLQRRPALYRFRGSVALRRYRAGEAVIRQGERGRSAFYVLTADDTLALLNALCRGARPRRPDPELLVEREAARRRVEKSQATEAVLRFGALAGPRLAHPGGSYPQEIDPRYTTVSEGELVGEAACLEGTPQPVTVVALRDCFLLEMQADFLAAVQEDPVQKARADSAYRTHILRLQLGRLPLFQDLSAEEFALVSDAVELRTVSPGTVIWDEHERCNGLYVVRAGIVKLVKNVSSLLGPDDVADWTRLREVLRDANRGRAPVAALWRRLSPAGRAVLSGPGAPGGPSESDRTEILNALNELILASDLLSEPELRSLADGVLPLGSGEVARRANRFAIAAVLRAALHPSGRGRGPECVLTYCTRGDVFGLPDLLLKRLCSATAVALGHPNALGRVELAWLPAAAFWRLLREVPRLREPLKQETARQRRNTDRRLATHPWDDPARQFSNEAVALGLVQGQQLMLIDLDRCTRCDECVHACASSRDDGLSRLFLDGARFGRHLVPTTCRACLDPVCLIGCPVGSIHRGPGQEIVIENWCIGCGLCSETCPYGAIQLHDVGLIPEAGSGWLFGSGETIGKAAWQRPEFRTAGWMEGTAPFFLDRSMRERLRDAGQRHDPRSIAFRHEFSPGSAAINEAGAYRLEVQSFGDVRVWVNGRECLPNDKPRGGRYVYTITAEGGGLRKGTNLLAAEVQVSQDGDAKQEPVFQARLDALRSEVTADNPMALASRPVTRRAAVCDLCAEQPAGPACIRACPHDAARRVDAHSGLPA